MTLQDLATVSFAALLRVARKDRRCPLLQGPRPCVPQRIVRYLQDGQR